MADPKDPLVAGRRASEVFDTEGEVGIARAACVGDVQVVERLVRDKVNPNAVGRGQVTPLMWALACRNARGVQALLENGASPNIRTQFGDMELDVMHIAALIPDSAFLRLLVGHGGDINSPGSEKSGKTPIFRAVTLGRESHNWENYYFLLDSGADINEPHGGSTLPTFLALLDEWQKVDELFARGYHGDTEQIAEIISRIRSGRQPARLSDDEYKAMYRVDLRLGEASKPDQHRNAE